MNYTCKSTFAGSADDPFQGDAWEAVKPASRRRCNGKVSKSTRRGIRIVLLDLHQIEQRMRLSIAQLAFVLEDVEASRRHLAPRGGAIMLEHIGQRFPQQLEI